MSLSIEKAQQIADRWADLWNNHTIPEYLSQYRDDIVLVSSLALRLFPDSNGILKEKLILEKYWSLIRTRHINFKFKINNVYTFENKIHVFYQSLDDTVKAIAILSVDDDDMIYRVEVSYV